MFYSKIAIYFVPLVKKIDLYSYLHSKYESTRIRTTAKLLNSNKKFHGNIISLKI